MNKDVIYWKRKSETQLICIAIDNPKNEFAINDKTNEYVYHGQQTYLIVYKIDKTDYKIGMTLSRNRKLISIL